MEDDLDLDKPPMGMGGLNKKVILIVAGVLLLVAINVGVIMFFVKGSGSHGGGNSPAEPGNAASSAGGHGNQPVKHEGPPIYVPLDPPFIVNFEEQGLVRFLQVSIEVMSYDQKAVDAIHEHTPAIRDRLLTLLSSQTYETLSAREGKEQIRTEGLDILRKIIKEHTGNEGIDALYFTSFIMQ